MRMRLVMTWSAIFGCLRRKLLKSAREMAANCDGSLHDRRPHRPRPLIEHHLAEVLAGSLDIEDQFLAAFVTE